MSTDIKKSLQPISFPVPSTEKCKQLPPQQWQESPATETVLQKGVAFKGRAGQAQAVILI